jgi:hypothetical protein
MGLVFDYPGNCRFGYWPDNFVKVGTISGTVADSLVALRKQPGNRER